MHKSSGQAEVTLSECAVYLGPYASAESRAKYDRVVAKRLVAGRQLPGLHAFTEC